MIIHTGTVATMEHWATHSERILNGMRLQCTKTAEKRGLTISGNEILEYTHMTQDSNGTWRAAPIEKATHIKVTVEMDAEQ